MHTHTHKEFDSNESFATKLIVKGVTTVLGVYALLPAFTLMFSLSPTASRVEFVES